MPELTFSNIDEITRDVRNQEITFSHLADDLIDHLCCDIENEMQKGLNFSEAYDRIKRKMGNRRLKEIQEETLYIIDSKYRFMKNTMKISGVAGTILFGFAVLFKIQHWAGAGMMMTLGAMILGLIFMPSALSVLWKETHSKVKLYLFVSTFLSGTFFISGVLFKVQHWPGAGTILILAAISAGFGLIPALLINRFTLQEKKAKRPAYILGASALLLYVAAMLTKIQHWPVAGLLMVLSIVVFSFFLLLYTWISWKEEIFINSRFIFLIIGSIAIVIPGAMVSINLQYSYEDGFFVNLDQQQALNNYLLAKNNSLLLMYHDSTDSGRMEQIHSQTLQIINLVNKIESEMIMESEGKPGLPAATVHQIRQTQTGTEIQFRDLAKPFHLSPVKDYLLPDTDSRRELDPALSDYLILLAEGSSAKDLQKYKALLDPLILLPATHTESTSLSLVSGLHSLQLLKNGILTVEGNVLQTIAHE